MTTPAPNADYHEAQGIAEVINDALPEVLGVKADATPTGVIITLPLSIARMYGAMMPTFAIVAEQIQRMQEGNEE